MWAVILMELILIPVIWLCYGNLIFMLPAQILVPFGVKKMKRYQQERKRTIFRQGFAELLTSFITSIQAGLSMENACHSALNERNTMEHKGSDPMTAELKAIVKKMKLGVPLTKTFRELGEKLDIEEIHEFAAVLEIVSVTGGNTVEILRNSLDHLREKMDTTAQIQMMMTGKRFEKNIMLVMPFVIILYLRLTNAEYMNCYYESIAGRIVMTGVLAVIAGGFFWAERIMKIEI